MSPYMTYLLRNLALYTLDAMLDLRIHFANISNIGDEKLKEAWKVSLNSVRELGYS